MKHPFSLRPTSAALAGLMLAVAPIAVTAQDAAGEWATPEQVERGEAAYQQKCSTCHGNDIVSIFKSFPSAGQFYGFVSTTMPGDAPGSLPAQQYADIIAFLAAENGMTVGTEELPADQSILDTIRPADFGAVQ